jgi:hypothetical protein
MVGRLRAEIPGEASVRLHHVDPLAGPQIVVRPVGKEAAGDPLDRHLELALLRRDAERIVAPNLLSADLRPERQMLAGPEAEGLAQFGRHLEPDRFRLGGLVDDLGDGEAVESYAHRPPLNGI